MILFAIEFNVPLVFSLWLLLGIAQQMSINAALESWFTSWRKH